MNYKAFSVLALLSILLLPFHSANAQTAANKVDQFGKELVDGPVRDGLYVNKHIISNSVGVIALSRGAYIENSIIEAPVCIQSSGMGLTIINSQLRCQVCVEYASDVRLDNQFMNVTCYGR